jgi:hypothetical protein
MADDIKAAVPEEPVNRSRVSDIGPQKHRAGMKVALFPRREIIDDGYRVPLCEKRLYQMRADETGAAGNENVHNQTSPLLKFIY